MKYLSFLLLFLCLACKQTPDTSKAITEKSPAPKTLEKKIAKNPNFRIIHVFVALCDNANQQIIKVPPKIGNGRDLENNLYWGCKFGTKTFLKTQNDWELIQTIPNTCEYILERCIFKHKAADVLLVADAYAGEFIEKCTSNFLQSCAGNFNSSFVLEKDSISCGGNADLLAYVGHDVLMDVFLGDTLTENHEIKREAIILACSSKTYFAQYLEKTGAKPLLWTTTLMAPEAYTLAAAMEKWVKKESDENIHNAAAQAYSKYQKCSVNAARKLLVSGW